MKTMSTKAVFIDSNILLYWVSADSRKAEIAQDILAAGPMVSVQVLNEFVAVSRHKHKASWEKIESTLRSTKVLCSMIVPLSLDVHERAMRIVQETNLPIYDACIVAAAELAGGDVLLTEDLNHGQRIGGITIHNPFA
jgi:predicted nucleic acid-binding protein